MTRKVTDIKGKDIDNIYDPAKGCVNNALHYKEADNNRPLFEGHVNNILLSKGATRSGLPGTKGAFSKHTLVDNTDSNGVKN